MRLPVNHALPLAALILLGAGPVAAKDRPVLQPMPERSGPAADYPVVVGDPFTIDKTVWTPTDQLNYDAVGAASVGAASLVGVTGAHKTLPLPSYVEVTALDTGRTILVRLERRGPMVNDVLIELSPDAAAQLGIAPEGRTPVRVRRVNPPEQERAVLRQNARAPERMATPEGLLKVLRNKLADQEPLLPPPSTPPRPPAVGADMVSTVPAITADAKPSSTGTVKPASKPAVKAESTAPKAAPAVPTPAKVPQPDTLPPVGQTSAASVAATAPPKAPTASAPTPKGKTYVQVGAFSSDSNARKAAAQVGGTVLKPGKYWLVRMGPYTNRVQAAPALEKAKAKGYSDARILQAD